MANLKVHDEPDLGGSAPAVAQFAVKHNGHGTKQTEDTVKGKEHNVWTKYRSRFSKTEHSK